MARGAVTGMAAMQITRRTANTVRTVQRLLSFVFVVLIEFPGLKFLRNRFVPINFLYVRP